MQNAGGYDKRDSQRISGRSLLGCRVWSTYGRPSIARERVDRLTPQNNAAVPRIQWILFMTDDAEKYSDMQHILLTVDSSGGGLLHRALYILGKLPSSWC